MNHDLIIHKQRQETERKNRLASTVMALMALFVLTVVYFSTRPMVEEANARQVALRMSCKYISNHTNETAQKVVVADCNGVIIHKAYE